MESAREAWGGWSRSSGGSRDSREQPTLHPPSDLAATVPQLFVRSPYLGHRYELLDWLGRGGMGEVFRARDHLRGRVVALKRVSTTGSGRPRFRDTYQGVALASEFRLLASLHHPNIVHVLDYGFDLDGRPFFTMELLDGACSVVEAAREHGFARRADLLLRMLGALAYLHRRGVIHRDIKPSNVVVHDGRVKLLDFGIAVLRGEPAGAAEGISGTLSYMAPEMVGGVPPSAATDLFAAGLIGYQIFTGHHPFREHAVPAVLKRLTEEDIDMEAVLAPSEVCEVLGRLLARNPADRYHDAAVAIGDLCRALGRGGAETPAIRESYLQSARLVGREAEIALLSDRLRTDRPGDGSRGGLRGGVFLVGGESGIGKTRLLDEIRIHAMVKGFQVLRGQARQEGGSPYEPWLEILRWLCLLAKPSDFEIGILQTLLPHVTEVVQRPVPTLLRFDPVAAQERLLRATVGLFRRLRRPTLVLLEDLHWCGNESLELLRRLSRELDHTPVVVLASFSDDEAPDLPARVPAAEVMFLSRLGEEDIAELSVAMLGEEGRRPDLVAFLARETEGNVFFLVEVMRTLAERAGHLAGIADMTLPEVAVSGGIRRLVRQRLSRVPGEARPMLDLAAVAGREIDLGLLRELEPAADLEGWLSCCAAAGLLELADNVWRFRHDQLRAAVLEDIEPGRHREIHAGIARALERLERPERPRTAALAHHWSECGDLRRGGYYAERAGLEALETGAYGDALVAFRRGAEMAADLRAPPEQQAFLYNHLGQAHLALGELEEGRRSCERAVELLGWPMPRWTVSRLGGLVVELVRHTLRRRFPAFFRGSAPSAARQEAVDIYDDLVRIYSLCRPTLSLWYAVLRRHNLAAAEQSAGGRRSSGARSSGSSEPAAGSVLQG